MFIGKNLGRRVLTTYIFMSSLRYIEEELPIDASLLVEYR